MDGRHRIRWVRALRIAAQSAPAIASPVAATPGTVDALQSILTRLRATLDAELHLQGRKIDEDEQFIQVGLDSISAVTWMRRINQEFGTAFEATTLYSYPTLRELSAFLKNHVEVATPAPRPAVVESVAEAIALTPVAAPSPLPDVMPARVAPMPWRRPVAAQGKQRKGVPTVETPAAPPATQPKDDERIHRFVDNVRVTGVRSSGGESRVLMNDKVYRVNDIVDAGPGAIERAPASAGASADSGCVPPRNTRIID